MAPEYIGPGFTSGTMDSAWDWTPPKPKEDRGLVSKLRRGIEMFLWAGGLDQDRNVGYRGCLDTAHEC